MALAIFLPSALQSIPHPEYYQRFREAGFFLIAFVVATTVGSGSHWSERRGGGSMGRTAVRSLVVEFRAQAGAESARVRDGAQHHSRAAVAALAERGLCGNVVHDCAGLPGSNALLWGRRTGDSSFAVA